MRIHLGLFPWSGSRAVFVHHVRKVRFDRISAHVEFSSESCGVSEKQAHRSFASHRGGDEASRGAIRMHKWKKIEADSLGIKLSMVPRHTRFVLSELKRNGFDVYLVGGCVRDLILKRIPKDFDILTSAKLNEILNSFPRSFVVGKRYPICHVHVKGTFVEVSSFSISAKKAIKEANLASEVPSSSDRKDYIRWNNCLQRDFTINGLIFDPYAKIIYDYLDGMTDINDAKVRTVIPANISFGEDSARILRAIRVAARLGFQFTKEVAVFIRELSFSVLKLDRGRIYMEMNYMMAFGCAEASLRLLWRYGLLELLLPFQAAYFVEDGLQRRDKRSNMLLSMMTNLDRLITPDRPCHAILWVALLTFHRALLGKPRDPMVIATFCLAVHRGGSLFQAVKLARMSASFDVHNFHELLQSGDSNADDDDDVTTAAIDLGESAKLAMNEMVDRVALSEALENYPHAPRSDLVFIPNGVGKRVREMFDGVVRGKEEDYVPNTSRGIDFRSLAAGDLPEIRHLFSRIVFDTIFPPPVNQQ